MPWDRPNSRTILSGGHSTLLMYLSSNLRLTGKLTLNGEKHAIEGKAWYDKQGGTYSLTNYRTNWEWFSFRFFDEEEIMLFSFPQTGYRDGTYVRGDGGYSRMNDYSIEPQGFIKERITKYDFSYGWKVRMPGVKTEEYTLKPKTEGQFNISFFELIADVLDSHGVLVGYCFVELLPGARNKKLNNLLAFKRQ